MKPISSSPSWFSVTRFLGSVGAQTRDPKDEIPIERCEVLPVVTMKVAGENRRFLLDTGATTILNMKSFMSGESGKIHVESWSGGTAATSAREVFLPEVELGTHKLRNLKLPAIDRTPSARPVEGRSTGSWVWICSIRWTPSDSQAAKSLVPAPTGQPGDSADAFAEAERDMGAGRRLQSRRCESNGGVL